MISLSQYRPMLVVFMLLSTLAVFLMAGQPADPTICLKYSRYEGRVYFVNACPTTIWVGACHNPHSACPEGINWVQGAFDQSVDCTLLTTLDSRQMFNITDGNDVASFCCHPASQCSSSLDVF